MATTIEKIRKNIMGTTSFNMKSEGHRGFQDFDVYPVGKDKTAESIAIQSDKRYGYYYPKTGKMELSRSSGGYSCQPKFAVDRMKGQTTHLQLSDQQNHELKSHIFCTTSAVAGKAENKCVSSDNSGAINIFSL